MEWNTKILERLQHYTVGMLTESVLPELPLILLEWEKLIRDLDIWMA